jgi:DsbC/DsbD-like thiol-disulfide interchange protein
MAYPRCFNLIACWGAFTVHSAVPAEAQPQARNDLVTARLVAERSALTPGEVAWLGVSFEIQEGWHLYWNGLNDSGMPIDVKLRLPEGYAQAGPMAWPAPKRHLLPGDILDHVYEGRVTLLLPVRVPENAAPGSRAEFAAEVRWFVCNDVCLPGDARVSLVIPVADASHGAPTATPEAPLFTEARARIPVPPPRDRVWMGWDSAAYGIVVPGAARLTFFPGPECMPLADPIGEARADAERLRLRLKARAGKQPRVSGVLEVRMEGKEPPRYWIVDSAVSDPGANNVGNR